MSKVVRHQYLFKCKNAKYWSGVTLPISEKEYILYKNINTYDYEIIPETREETEE